MSSSFLTSNTHHVTNLQQVYVTYLAIHKQFQTLNNNLNNPIPRKNNPNSKPKIFRMSYVTNIFRVGSVRLVETIGLGIVDGTKSVLICSFLAQKNRPVQTEQLVELGFCSVRPVKPERKIEFFLAGCGILKVWLRFKHRSLFNTINVFVLMSWNIKQMFLNQNIKQIF